MKEIPIEKVRKIEAFYSMAYDDYIAGRVLLNGDHILQGAILASSAVEKYFKGLLLAVRDDADKVPKVHLTRYSELKEQFSSTEYVDIFKMFDNTFIEELCTVYRFRYYDNFKEPTSIGFLVNQFLGELDYMAFIFNSVFKSYNPDKTERGSKYNHRVIIYDNDLHRNNYILNKVEKEDFMNRESRGFSFYINPKTLEPITMISKGFVKPGTETTFKTTSGDITLEVPKYSGNIFRFLMRGKNDKN